MVLLQRYMSIDGADVIRNCLAANNAVLWTASGNEADLAIFQEVVIRGVTEKLFEGINDFMMGVKTQHPSTQANSSSLATSNHGPQALAWPGIASPTGLNIPSDQLPTNPGPPPGTASPMSFSEIDSVAGGFDDTSQHGDQFNQWFGVLESG
ncbi:hypothetical protein EKO27_g2302 [Xylaria grammica]|uniref:Uncharacterized protein n=1 Tax=Xylaria grammica TaxID=363999 RepID=A0A439DEK1_9PEZI|nr:hypothetical protein EKO27_g2302 [Xylaria grammica]